MTSTSTVGLPRLSRISRACRLEMVIGNSLLEPDGFARGGGPPPPGEWIRTSSPVFKMPPAAQGFPKTQEAQARLGWHALSPRRACRGLQGLHALRRLRACHPGEGIVFRRAYRHKKPR